MRNIEEMLTALLVESTQKELSVKLGTTTKSIQNWLSGSFKPEREMTRKIVELFKKEKPPVKLQEVDGKIIEALIRIEARQIAHESHFAEIYARLAEVPATKILKELQQAGTLEVNRLRNELQ